MKHGYKQTKFLGCGGEEPEESGEQIWVGVGEDRCAQAGSHTIRLQGNSAKRTKGEVLKKEVVVRSLRYGRPTKASIWRYKMKTNKKAETALNFPRNYAPIPPGHKKLRKKKKRSRNKVQTRKR